MANVQPVTFARHGNKRWQRFSDHTFAAHSTIAPLMLPEVRSAANAFPLAFLKYENNLVPVAILGLDAETNVFVDGAGRWLASYTPAALRVWPFSIATSAKRETLLCIDEDSNLVTDGPDGEAFFNNDGSPSAALDGVLRFIAHFTQEREPSIAACAALQVADVLEPWNVVVRTATREWSMEGFLRINESALQKISDKALAALHKAGALSLAYAQLQSMAHLTQLGLMAELRRPGQGEDGMAANNAGDQATNPG